MEKWKTFESVFAYIVVEAVFHYQAQIKPSNRRPPLLNQLHFKTYPIRSALDETWNRFELQTSNDVPQQNIFLEWNEDNPIFNNIKFQLANWMKRCGRVEDQVTESW